MRAHLGGCRRIARLAGLLLLLVPAAGLPEEVLTLEQALREARTANARLPLPAFELDIARQKSREARAERWFKVALDGGLIYAPPGSYDPALTNLGEERFLVVARQPVFDGGARSAAVASAEAGVEAAGARYRIAEKDLDLEVRARFNELCQARAEGKIRREGIEHLNAYESLLRSRQASGQGVAADVLKTQVRLAAEEADALESDRRADEARIALNELMGRDPAGALAVEELAAPEAPAGGGGETWTAAPDIAEAEAQIRSADANLALARSEAKLHLFVAFDFGFWGSDTTQWIPDSMRASDPDATFPDRVRRDAGYSLSLGFSLPLWDFGAIRARVAQAQFSLDEARQRLEVERRQTRLRWEQAAAALPNLYRQIEILAGAVPVAWDSYLQTESRYRGGSATTLEVLDAQSAAVDARVRLADAILRYHIAQAVALRWGTP
ncbi:MAG: TolC family protein [Thermoanaerobaculia bacterium]